LSSNDSNDCGCEHFDGLDLLPFNLNVHFPGNPARGASQSEDRMQEFLTSHPNRSVWALEDGAYLKVDNDAIRFCAGDLGNLARQPAYLSSPPSQAALRSLMNKAENRSRTG